MKQRKIRKGIVLTLVAGALGLGCELIVDFDRNLIPVDGNDSGGSTGDSSFDTAQDTFQPDTSVPDAADADAADAADTGDAPDGD
jgi:hypothetical protein